MAITCEVCGRMSTGAYFPTDVRAPGESWTVGQYDAYQGPVYCSVTCRHADNRGPAPTYQGE